MEKIKLEDSAEKHVEREIKFILTAEEISFLKEKMSEEGFEHISEKYEKTIMYDRSGEMEEIDARLRMRVISEKAKKIEKVEISFKQRSDSREEGEIDVQKEIEFDVDGEHQESIEMFLAALRYQKTTSYERYRETYSKSQIQVTIDQFPYGYVVEIEAPNDDLIEGALTSLNLEKEGSTIESCDDIYERLCQEQGKVIQKDILFTDKDMPKL